MNEHISKLIDIINLENDNNYLITENDKININILSIFLKNNFSHLNNKLDSIYYHINSILMFYGIFISEPSESEINTVNIYYYLKIDFEINIDLYLLNKSFITFLSFPNLPKILDFLFTIKPDEFPYSQKNFKQNYLNYHYEVKKCNITDLKDKVNFDKDLEESSTYSFKNQILKCKLCCFQ